MILKNEHFVGTFHAFRFEEKKKRMHSVGFEPTSTNTMQLECTPLDRSGMNAPY